MAFNKTATSSNTKAFIDKIVANSNIALSYNNNSNNNIIKKKFSLDHSTPNLKEPFSTKSLNYFISPRSSSEQIFKSIKNMAMISKNNNFSFPKPHLLNNSHSILKENNNNNTNENKEKMFLKHMRDNWELGKKKKLNLLEKQQVEEKRDKNTTEIIDSLESLKNKYKTLKEMNFLKCKGTTQKTEMICPSKFSKIANNNKLRFNLNESKIKTNQSSTFNTNNENSKITKSNATRKNQSGNMSNVLSTNSNSESEIQPKNNEKDQKICKNSQEKTLLSEVFQKNMSMFTVNKDKIIKMFQNLKKKHQENQPKNMRFSRNLSIPENNLQISNVKKKIERRNSLHCEISRENLVSEQLVMILGKTKKIMENYTRKENKWMREKKEMSLEISQLKRRLIKYEVL